MKGKGVGLELHSDRSANMATHMRKHKMKFTALWARILAYLIEYINRPVDDHKSYGPTDGHTANKAVYMAKPVVCC